MPLRNPGGDDFVEITFRLSLTFIFSGPTWKTLGKILGNFLEKKSSENFGKILGKIGEKSRIFFFQVEMLFELRFFL